MVLNIGYRSRTLSIDRDDLDVIWLFPDRRNSRREILLVGTIGDESADDPDTLLLLLFGVIIIEEENGIFAFLAVSVVVGVGGGAAALGICICICDAAANLANPTSVIPQESKSSSSNATK